MIRERERATNRNNIILALTMTGYVISADSIHASASEGVEKASSDPLIIDTLALIAKFFADTLSPNVLLFIHV